MLVTRIAEVNQVVVKWQGYAYWFDTMEEAEKFMTDVENELLY